MAHILVVDDEEVLRDILSQILEAMGHTCDLAANGREGVERVESGEYDLIITDIRMPEMSGIDFLKRIESRVASCTPCMIITAMADEPSIAIKAVRLACDFLSKPFQLVVVQRAVERALTLREAWVFRRTYQRELERALQRLEGELRETEDGVLIGFAAMLEGKDGAQDEEDDAKKQQNGTKLHCWRVKRLCCELARAMGIEDEKDLRNIEYGAILHDVGKYRVPDAILWKKGKLTEEEWQVMRCHPEYGAEFVGQIPFLSGAADLILHHHEKWDGSGYPRGLRGDEIPLPARIFSVVDAFDAMRSDRCYREKLSEEKALEELRENAGTQFDPAVVETFERIYPELRACHAALMASAPRTNGQAARLDSPAVRDLAEMLREKAEAASRDSVSR